MSIMPFNHKRSIEQYINCLHLITIGAYDKREPDGSYGADGVERRMDTLIFQAAQQGLKFVATPAYDIELHPMTDLEKADFALGKIPDKER